MQILVGGMRRKLTLPNSFPLGDCRCHIPELRVGTLSDRPYNGSMNQLQIKSVSAINGYILLVFYTPGNCWQFRLISPDGSVYGLEKIFYTSEAAREAGVIWVGGEK